MERQNRILTRLAVLTAVVTLAVGCGKTPPQEPPQEPDPCETGDCDACGIKAAEDFFYADGEHFSSTSRTAVQAGEQAREACEEKKARKELCETDCDACATQAEGDIYDRFNGSENSVIRGLATEAAEKARKVCSAQEKGITRRTDCKRYGDKESRQLEQTLAEYEIGYTPEYLDKIAQMATTECEELQAALDS